MLLIGCLAWAGALQADPAVPGKVLDPGSAAEAWNVIRLVTRNVEQLLEEKRTAEIAVQISYCSPSLRALPRMASRRESVPELEAQIARAFKSVNAIASAAQQNNPAGAAAALASLRGVLDQSARLFDPKTVGADIFVCPMHPEALSEDARASCSKCGMDLLARRIPASAIYTQPGSPTLHLTAAADGLLEAGKPAQVKVRLWRADKSPVAATELLEMHTEKIHLLIEEPGLGDYHHEHPVPTGVPGEYTFQFTPRKSRPYRIWADLVPAATGIQELPFVDLGSAGQAAPPEDTTPRFTSEVGGYRFELSFHENPGAAPKAGQTRKMAIRISDRAGQPVTTLEPVMNAFAHLVGFYGDFRTVIHLHPTGGEILNPALRGGPALSFLFFAPKPGFIRLYCQVKVGGQMLFAPFNVEVAKDEQ